jgi:hypothetical protein
LGRQQGELSETDQFTPSAEPKGSRPAAPL